MVRANVLFGVRSRRLNRCCQDCDLRVLLRDLSLYFFLGILYSTATATVAAFYFIVRTDGTYRDGGGTFLTVRGTP